MKRALGVFVAVATIALARPAHARGCSEVSDIVGYERCHRFGDGWAVERRWPIVLSLELPYQTFDPRGVDFDFQREKADPNAFSVPGRELGPNVLSTAGLALRGEGFFWRWLYVGAEIGFGLGHNEIGSFTATVGDASKTFTTSESAINTVMMQGGVLLGVRVPLGRLSLRLEGFAGGSILTVDSSGGYSGTAGRGLLMPRAAADFWVSPNVTFSAYGGFDALDTRNQTLGLAVAFHVRSFDGAFSLW